MCDTSLKTGEQELRLELVPSYWIDQATPNFIMLKHSKSWGLSSCRFLQTQCILETLMDELLKSDNPDYCITLCKDKLFLLHLYLAVHCG